MLINLTRAETKCSAEENKKTYQLKNLGPHQL